MPRMDPLAVLELDPGATPDEIAAAYRRQAKRWHPDRGGGLASEARMAQINGAYELLRAQAWTQRHEHPATAARPAPPARAGAWLAPSVRHALGRELLGALEPAEPVWLVTPTTTWRSPQALLAASDRRLLWLLDDAVTGRVQAVRFAAVAEARHILRRPRRRVATLRLVSTGGRRLAFGDLRPATAEALVARIAAARPALRRAG